MLYAERRHVIFNPKGSVESPFHRLLNLIRLIDVILDKTLYNLHWYFTVFYPMILSVFNVLLTNCSILGAAILNFTLTLFNPGSRIMDHLVDFSNNS